MLKIQNIHRPGLLEPCSLEVGKDECCVVMGASGSGKSVLMRAIADLDPNTGKVFLEGKDRESFTGPQWRKQVTYQPAEAGWWAEKVGPHFEDIEGAKNIARHLNLQTEIFESRIPNLSTGERQRLALIRSLMLKPRVLLLDEPTSGLDPASVTSVETLLLEKMKQGTAILMTSHDAQQAERLGARVITMNRTTNGGTLQ